MISAPESDSLLRKIREAMRLLEKIETQILVQKYRAMNKKKK